MAPPSRSLRPPPGAVRAAAPLALLPHPGSRAVVLAGLPGVIVLFILTALDVAGMAMWWEMGHWTLTAAMAAALAALGARGASGTDRRVRALGAAALGAFLAGQLLWDGQVAQGLYPVPAPSDAMFLGMAVPFIAALALAVRSHGSRGELRTFALDTLVLAAAIMAIVFFFFAPIAAGAMVGLGLVLLLYPIIYLGLTAAIAVAALLTRSPVAPRGLYLAAAGIALMGGNWVWSIDSAIRGRPTTGSLVNMLGSVAILLIGLGVATWRVARPSPEPLGRPAARVITFLPVGAIVIAAAIVVEPHLVKGEIALVEAAAVLAIVVAIVRQTLLLGDRTAILDRERRASERERELRETAQHALTTRAESEARYRALVDVFDRLGERTTFATEESEMFTAAAAALAQLVPAPAGNILTINPSANRLGVTLAWGEGAPAPGSALELEAPERCFGIRRRATFGVEDAADPWNPACPAHPAARGSILCVPMTAGDKLLGVVHLARPDPGAFDEDDRRNASRIAEQVALAVSNVRLIRTMEGLALSDALTGLHNGRFFGPSLDLELAHAERDGTAVGVIAIDLDHFKAFNDNHGHLAGDEALRTFARGCLGALRKSDTMARLGGEEFWITVPGADLAATVEVAEKLRTAVEHLAVEVGPGRFARITASFGVANSRPHGTDRTRLMRTADRALYAAKRQGRNAVVAASGRSSAGRAHPPADTATSGRAPGG